MSAKSRVTLPGLDPLLRPGDRLLDAAGPDRTLNGRPLSITAYAATNDRVMLNAQADTTTLDLLV